MMVHQWLTNDHVPRNESYVAFQLTTAHRDLSTHYGNYYRASNFFIDEKDGERYHYPDVAQWKYSKMRIKKNPRVAYADDYSGRESRMSAADWAEAMSELQRSRPRPLAKAFGTNGPNEMQLKNWTAQSKDWNSRYRYASKMQKAALIRDNAEFAARKNPKPYSAIVRKILQSDASDNLKILRLQNLALLTFASSPKQLQVIAAYKELQNKVKKISQLPPTRKKAKRRFFVELCGTRSGICYSTADANLMTTAALKDTAMRLSKQYREPITAKRKR